MNEENKELNKEQEEELLNEEMAENQEETVEEQTEGDKLAECETKYNELNDAYLRLNAEFDNYRKRTIKEKADLLRSGSERVLVDVITVVDDFERALDHITKTDDIEALREGVNLIYDKFIGFLGKNKVEAIDALGQPFNTDKHEALTTIPAQSDDDKDKVVDCIQKGYTLDGKVIRYSKVIVAK